MSARNVLITGASRGLGGMLAVTFSERGDHVIGIYHRAREEAVKLEALIRSGGGECRMFQTDIGDSRQVMDLFRRVREDFHSLDVLINNAGVVRDQLILRMSERDWDEVLRVNLKGAFLCIREAVPLMKGQARISHHISTATANSAFVPMLHRDSVGPTQRTVKYASYGLGRLPRIQSGLGGLATKSDEKCGLGGSSGHVINVSSLMGLTGNRGQANYSASKAGLIALTQSAALELAYLGIKVNAVIPGRLPTAMNAGQARSKREGALGRGGAGPADGDRSLAAVAQWIYRMTQWNMTGQVFILEDRVSKYAGLPNTLARGDHGYRNFVSDRTPSA